VAGELPRGLLRGPKRSLELGGGVVEIAAVLLVLFIVSLGLRR
jgi:hypothetical protein